MSAVGAAMRMSDFLSPADVFIGIRGSNKAVLLQLLAAKAASNLNIALEDVATTLRKREALGSTGVGDGVAIPHARLSAVTRPFGIFAKLKNPVEFDAIDGLPVDLVFLLLLPSAAENGPRGALALVARTLRSPTVRSKLRHSRTEDELYAVVTGIAD